MQFPCVILCYGGRMTCDRSIPPVLNGPGVPAGPTEAEPRLLTRSRYTALIKSTVTSRVGGALIPRPDPACVGGGSGQSERGRDGGAGDPEAAAFSVRRLQRATELRPPPPSPPPPSGIRREAP
ncbi:hypothetical protein SKAU_G00364570 [Synaphobranchus kaupii]|uniref:Uncharacterized protein n=1 Tax=Synaphobranchus kaupii TaxID=118154 RepID=A0A9Q1EET8_SYNKA|nr:hypothetical protein SKAU_G00364570 [Synaphobranchus kaupii]